MKLYYLTADEEDNYVVAQANEPLDENGKFINKRVYCPDCKGQLNYFEVER